MIRFDGAFVFGGFSNHLGDAEQLAVLLADPDHAVHVHALVRHLLDRDHVGAGGEVLRGIDHLRQAAALVLHQHVGEQQRERLAADQLTRAPHRVPEAERLLLAGEAGRARPRQVLGEKLEISALLPLAQRHLEFELAVEVVLDDALVAAGHKDEVLDSGLPRLVDHVLDHRPVDHRQHLLRHRLGGGQESGPQAGDGENSLANRFHCEPLAQCATQQHGIKTFRDHGGQIGPAIRSLIGLESMARKVQSLRMNWRSWQSAATTLDRY